MTAALTYYLRSGHLSAIASGKAFYLPTYQEESRIADWGKIQELHSGKVTLWDHCFEVPRKHFGESIPINIPAGKTIVRLNPGSTSKLEVVDYPGYYAKKLAGEAEVSGAQHMHLGTAVYVGDQRGGIYIHGWPPCNLKRCVVVMQHWEDVWQAIAAEPELSFSLVY